MKNTRKQAVALYYRGPVSICTIAGWRRLFHHRPNFLQAHRTQIVACRSKKFSKTIGRMNTQSGVCEKSTNGKTSRMFGRFTNSRKIPKLRRWHFRENFPDVQ